MITIEVHDIMKKILLIFLLIFLLVGCSSGKYSKLDYQELMNKLENKDTFILLVNDESEDGKLLRNTLNKILEENNLSAYEINPNDITQDEKNKIRDYFSYENVSIIFIKDGFNPSKLTNITNPSISINELTNHLTNLGFITNKNLPTNNEETPE